MLKQIAMTILACAPVLMAAEPTPGEAAWKKLQTLAGTWEGTEAGRTTTMTYTVVSGGHTLIESMKMPEPEPDMVTVYHRDGEALMATHYCSMGNQPRMKASAPIPAGDAISFRFVDVTNLKKPGSGHIKHLTVKFVDAEHFVQEWTSTDGKKEEKMAFRWTRKK
jgi:hypothetical protein